MDPETGFQKLVWGAETVLTPEDLGRRLQHAARQNKPLRVKLGVDPTAPDIHLGHTVVLRKLRQFQDLGHEAVLIIGGFTARIGDPSGKSKTRPPLTRAEIQSHAGTYLDQVRKILDPARLTIVDNSEWLDAMPLQEVLKLLSHATLSKLLEHNTFRDRLDGEGSIRMHEFIYPFLQGYDSVHLEADVELGGTDQLFNVAFGRELQRQFGQEPQVALLFPILTGTDGVQKMSKSLDNIIGVNDSPLVMAQKILNMPDSNIVPYYKLLTSLEPAAVQEITRTLEQPAATAEILEIKNHLADLLIQIYHPGRDRTETARFVVPENELQDGRLNVLKAIVLTGFAASNREASQYLQSGAVRVAGEPVSDRHYLISLNAPVLLAVGRKKLISLERDAAHCP